MRKIFSHRSRHTVVTRLPCHNILYVQYLDRRFRVCENLLNAKSKITLYEIIPITTHESSIDDHCTRNSDSILSHCRRNPSPLCVAIFTFSSMTRKEPFHAHSQCCIFLLFIFTNFFFLFVWFVRSPWTFLWKWYFN